MNILQMASNMKRNGPAMVVYDLSWGLAEMGHNVYIAAGDGELVSELKHPNIHFVHIPIDRVPGNKVKQVVSYVKNGISTYYQLNRLIKEKKIEIINSHQPISNLYAKRLSKACKIPFVTTSHNVYSPGYLSKTYVSGDHVVAVSEKVYNNSISTFGVSKEKITCISNGINPHRLVPDNPLNYEGKFVIGTLAGLRKQKALDKLIKAYSLFEKEVTDSILAIAGSGEEEERLRALVTELQLNDKVDFLGFRNDSANVFEGLDIFALSSEYEGLPISMLEAMAMKVPVVVTAVGGIPEVITNGDNGLMCNYGDEAGLAKHFFTLYNSNDLCSTIAMRGYETVLEQFNFHLMAKSYADVYRQLL